MKASKRILSLVLCFALICTFTTPMVFAKSGEDAIDSHTLGEYGTEITEHTESVGNGFGANGIQAQSLPTASDPEDPELYYLLTGQVLLRQNDPINGITSEAAVPGRPLRIRVMTDFNLIEVRDFGTHMSNADGYFSCYILKSVVAQYEDNLILDINIDEPGYQNGYTPDDIPYTIGDLKAGRPATSIIWCGGFAEVNLPLDNLPATPISPAANARIAVLMYRSDSSWSWEVWSDSYKQEIDGNEIMGIRFIEPGSYKFAFTYYDRSKLERYNWAQNVGIFEAGIFQYFGGEDAVFTLAEAEEITVRAGDHIELSTFPWDGDRSHAEVDVIPPRVQSAAPFGADIPSDGQISIDFNEPMDKTVQGTVTLKSAVDEFTLSAGVWTENARTYTTDYSGLTAGRLYNIVISGFKDVAGNEMESNEANSFSVVGGYIQRTLTETTAGISIEGAITPDAELSNVQGYVHEQGADPACNAIHDADGQGLLLALHGISVLGGSFSGSITISIPIPEQYNGRTVNVLHCKNANLETVSAIVTGGKVSFTLSSLSPIGVALPASVSIPDTSWYVSHESDTSYSIGTADALAGLAQIVKDGTDSFDGKTITLTSDIDLSAYGAGYNGGKGWVPIGYHKVTPGDASINYPFKGTFDGDGHEISGLYIDESLPTTSRVYAGLFGSIANGTSSNAKITDVILCDVNVSSFWGWAGGLVGVADGGIVDSCSVSGSVSGSICVGGLVGDTGDGNGVIVRNSYATADVTGAENLGGVVGRIQNAILQNCYSTGSVNGIKNVGGVVGNLQGVATNCYATGVVIGTTNVGGIAGIAGNPPNLSVTNCAALNEKVEGTSYVGRVAGNDEVPSLSGNVAFTGMLNGAGTTLWPGNALDNIDGFSKTTAELQAAGGFPAGFTSAPWTYTAGKLPGLGGMAANMPIHLNGKVNAQRPIITVQPESATVAQGSAQSLTVTASVSDGGSLTYQWYESSTTNSGGTAIGGATSASYTVPTAAVGTKYYYAVITNTISDNSDGGVKTAQTVSNVAYVTVNEAIQITMSSAYLDSPKVGQPLHGDARVIYRLWGATYAAVITPAHFTVSGLPAGLSAGTSVRVSDTFVEIPITGTPTIHNPDPAYLTYAVSIPQSNIVGVPVAVIPSGTIAVYPIAKGDGPAAPAVSGSYTGNGTDFTYTVTTIAGAEYCMDSKAWQDSNVFTSIVPSSKHTFSVRIKESANYEAGTAGSTGLVTFSKLENNSVPTLGYAVSGISGNKTITITPVTGAEYQFGADGWGNTNTKTYVSDVNETIYIRYPATATHNASASASTIVNLANAEQDAPLPFTLTFAFNTDGVTYTATIPDITGGEYSFDGVNFSGINSKTDCAANTAYTGYVRLAAKPGFNASSVTSDTKTTPMLTVKTPVLSPASGSFSGSQTVTITCVTPGAGIYYTTDGSTPTSGSTPYTAPFIVSTSTTVKAIAIFSGMNNSTIATVTYTHYTGGGSSGGGGGYSETVYSETVYSFPTGQSLTWQRGSKNGLTITADAPYSKFSDIRINGFLISNANYTSKSGSTIVTFKPEYLETLSVGSHTVRVNFIDGYAESKITIAPYDPSKDNQSTGALNPFTDVSEDDWFFNAVLIVYDQGLFTGTSETTFSPQMYMTRGMFVTVIARLDGVDLSGYTTSPFTDVDINAYYGKAVAWAADEGITGGIGGGKFAPDKAITREEMAVLLYKYMMHKGITLPETGSNEPFSDSNQFSPWAVDAIADMRRLGLISGVGGNRFNPQGTATRAEVAQIFLNYLISTVE